MSPRPRTVSDPEILAAASRVIGRVGPAKATLARIAVEAGLAPATLLQRFGSKRGLLLALGRAGEPEGGASLTALRREHDSPLAALREFLLCFSGMASTPDELANHLAAYQMDIADAELREVTVAIGRENEATVRALLGEAIERGELRSGTPEGLARVLLATVMGSLLAWAVFREGKARAWLARDLETLLGPYLAAPGGTGARRRGKPGRAG